MRTLTNCAIALRRPGTKWAAVTAAVACAGALSGAIAFAQPASATDEKYGPCGSCAEVSGAVNYIKNNAAENVKATGVCSEIHFGTESRAKCVESPANYIRVCLTSEVHGYGEAHLYYMQYLYDLRGREDNYSALPECGYIEA